MPPFLRPQASDPRKSLETLAFGRILGHLLGSVFHTSRKALRKEAELKSSTLCAKSLGVSRRPR